MVERLAEFGSEGVLIDSALLESLVEQLKLPLLQVASLAELSLSAGSTQQTLQTIATISRGNLALVDAYLMAARQEYGQVAFGLEPVSPSACLQDVAYKLADYAAAHNFDIEVSLDGKFEPVMGHRQALEAALFSMAHALFDGDGFIGEKLKQRPVLVLGAHRTPTGIALGVFVQQWQQPIRLGLQQSKRLLHATQQPLAHLSPAGSAGVFVADALLRSMAATVRAGRHHFYSGLATTLQPSQQLALLT